MLISLIILYGIWQLFVEQGSQMLTKREFSLARAAIDRAVKDLVWTSDRGPMPEWAAGGNDAGRRLEDDRDHWLLDDEARSLATTSLYYFAEKDDVPPDDAEVCRSLADRLRAGDENDQEE